MSKNKKAQVIPVATAKVGPVRVTPRKIGEIANLVRAKDVNSALTILRFSPARRTAGLLSKVILSAVANASQKNPSLDVDTLIVSEILVGNGPIMKRFMARAKGSASRILKRTARVSVTIAEGAKVAKKQATTQTENNTNRG